MVLLKQQEIRNKAIACEIDARECVARYDMLIGLAQIVRPLKTGGQRMAFDIRQKWMGGVVRLMGITLDDHDLGVLLSLVMIAQQQKPSPRPGGEIVGLLPLSGKKQNFVNLAASHDVVTVAATFAAVRKILGIKADCAGVNDAIRQSILRLSTIVVDARGDEKWAFTHLIHHVTGSGYEKLCVTLSYRLTRALLGEE